MWTDLVPQICMTDAITLDFWGVARTKAGVDALTDDDFSHLVVDRALLSSFVQ